MKQTTFSTISILCIIILSLGCLAVAPYVYRISMQDQVDSQEILLTKLGLQTKRIMADLERQKQQVEQYGEQTLFLLEGSTTGIAGANLQKRVTEVVKQHNGNASSFQIQSPEKENELTRIVMNISLRADIVSIQKILHELETGTPFIFIEDMTIQAQEKNTGSSPALQRQKLDISMKIIGYFENNKNI